MTDTPADVKDAARRAVSAALRDQRTGFAIKACMIGGAYEAFTQAIEAAILAERERCAVRAEENWNGAPLYQDGKDIARTIRGQS